MTEPGSPYPHVEITADWNVSDADRDLNTVTVAVFDAPRTYGRRGVNDPRERGSAGGTDQFKIKHANGGTFDVTVTVTDGGNMNSRPRSVTE